MIVFLHIPKTGGTSFRFVLENNFGLRHCHTTHAHDNAYTEADFNFAKKVFPHLDSLAGHNLIDPPRLPFTKPFFVTILRDPVARVISHYLQLHRRSPLNHEYEKAFRQHGELENLHVKLMAGQRDLGKAKQFLEKHCGFVGFTEKFDLSLHVFDRLSPVKLDVRYLKQRITPGSPLKKQLAADTRFLEMVREHNQLDLELYSFAMEEVFPRLCERAGIRPGDVLPPLNNYPNNVHLNSRLCKTYNRLVYRQLCKLRQKPPQDAIVLSEKEKENI